jgi:hypothetical protein
MKLLGCGLVAALLSSLALGLGATSALADPIAAPWTATGWMQLDEGLGVTRCTVNLGGAANGNSITSIVFSACTGVLGTPVGLMPAWPVTWNGTNTGGTIAVAKSFLMFGSIFCLGSGSIPFTYSAGTFTIRSAVMAVVGGPICPRASNVSGSMTI